jgi:hypothetical protein
MKTCVLIEVDDQGQVSVGTYPGELPPQFKQGLQPAQSVDEALATAKQLLEGGGEEQGETAPDNETGEGQPAQAEGNFRQGFHKAQPAGPVKGPMTGGY